MAKSKPINKISCFKDNIKVKQHKFAAFQYDVHFFIPDPYSLPQMLLILTAMDTNKEIRNFTWWFSNLEVCFEFLSKLSADGNHLLRIELIDKDKHTLLPVEAFDGTSFSQPIQALQLEWQNILSLT